MAGSMPSSLVALPFPIVIQDRGDLQVVLDIAHFMQDPDICFHPFIDEMAIDARGRVWSWKYVAKCNVPDRVIREVDLEHCKDLFRKHVEGVRIEAKITSGIAASKTFEDLFTMMSEYFSY